MRGAESPGTALIALSGTKGRFRGNGGPHGHLWGPRSKGAVKGAWHRVSMVKTLPSARDSPIHYLILIFRADV